MPDIADGEEVEVQGSGSAPYVLANDGGIYSCTCPAWRFQSQGIDQRTCKHLRAYRGDELETERVGTASRTPAPRKPASARRAAASEGAAPSPQVTSSGVAPQLLLAHKWDDAQDLTGWWLSEKLDGVRAYWNGEQFLSRQGNVFLAPSWFVDGFPDFPLDGELWIGRQEFQSTVSVVRRVDGGEEWRRVRYLVFDAPGAEGVFEERLEFAKQVVAGMPEHVHVVAHTRCESNESLVAELRRVERLGGEGLMARKPRSKYMIGRSTTCLKVKTFYDAEGRVLRHVEGTGKHMGRLGALECELPDGTTFAVGTGFTDKQRESPPAIGSIVTFRFQELTKGGVPRFTSFVAERIDLAWEQIQWPPEAMADIPEVPTHELPIEDLAEVAALEHEETVEVSRQLQFDGGRTPKFWEVEQQGNEIVISYGRVGKEPKVKREAFRSRRRAAERANELADAKLAKGYEEF